MAIPVDIHKLHTIWYKMYLWYFENKKTFILYLSAIKTYVSIAASGSNVT